MYAVVKIGGRQYRVGVGDLLRVDYLPAMTVGEKCVFRPLLVWDGDGFSEEVDTLRVGVEVLGHGRGDKVRILKRKRRKKYRRTAGFRGKWTLLKIEHIGGDSHGA